MVALALPSDSSISETTMIPDLLARHPNARQVLDRYGLRGCGGRLGPAESLGFFAATHGVQIDLLLCDLRETIAHPAEACAASTPKAEDAIYRRFFLGAIATVLTAGASWGAIILWQIGFQGKFTGVSLQHVNAHGQAQIYGWCALFIMGFAYQAFPRMWQTELFRPRLAGVTFLLMLAGVIFRSIGMISGADWGIPATLVGGGAQILASVIFAIQIFVTFQRSSARVEPYIGFILLALFWMIAMTVLDQWHTYRTLSAGTREALIAQIATWQAPLRDMQIHGLLLFTILGVSMRMLPPLFGVPAVTPRRAWRALIVLSLAVSMEVIIFLIYRLTMNHAIAALLMIPWITLTVGVWMVAGPFKLWRKPPIQDRSVKFIRAAHAWLAISLVMLLLLPVHQQLSRIPFSHAYYGAIRHAITVGFASLMIMGMAAKVVPTLNGRDPRQLTALWWPFALVNMGCFLRVSLQALTDFYPRFFAVIGISGVLEVIGLGIWAVGLTRIMLKRSEERIEVQPHARSIIRGQDHVGEVVDSHPGALATFVDFGFTQLKNPMLRRTIARAVTIQQAAAMHGVKLDELLAALNQSKVDEHAAIG